MAGFENDVLLCKNINFDTAAPKPHLGIITAGGQLPIGTGNTSPTPEILAGSITSPDFSLDIGYSSPNITAQINPNIRKSGGYYQNLGINYNAGTGVFTVRGADADLSASNPAFVTFQSIINQGELVTIEITSNQSFIDANGASEIIGNTFGFTSGIAITVDVPFFIYAVINDTEDAVAFAIGKVPGYSIGSVTGNPSTPGATAQFSLFALENVTLAEYVSNSAVMVGSFRMQMDASDDWTVQSLNYFYDGIGNFQELNAFTMPLGQLGANAGTITINNSGTAAVFSSVQTRYKITRDGYCLYRLSLAGDGGTDGSGGVEARVTCPFVPTNITSVLELFPSLVSFAGGNGRVALCDGPAGAPQLRFRIDNAATALLWSQFTNGGRSIHATLYYEIFPGP